MIDKIPQPEEMDFKLTEEEPFDNWVIRVQPRLRYLASIVGRKSRTEAKVVRDRIQQEELIHHLDFLLENLSDIALEVKELVIRSKEYYQDWLARETAKQLKTSTDSLLPGKQPARKPVQDYCQKLNCSERRIMDRLEAMNETIEFRTTTCQSMIKSMKV